MLTSLVSLLQGNVKKSDKFMKPFILKNKIFISFKNLNNFHETFRKDVTQNNNLSLENIFMEKPHGNCREILSLF